ncbi:inositol monophosphatase family protein [Chrysiogenes arsenatis]|uniref:inositol monophosphatase family protein n=1 Tax=Chrysiogenes arsenatis TaxID=309797 RepID=UPI00040777B7|nr:inositol monophosphatase family protein [Chrysiogenes arsenatis]
MNATQFTVEVVDLVWKAGAIIREQINTAKDIQYKGEIDLVTSTDLAVEAFLKEGLAKLFPDYTLVAEESADISSGKVPAKAIYIDPIDGTTNFAHDFPFVAISVGAYRDGQGEWGIVYNPYSDELYHAVAQQGAYLNGNAIQISHTDSLRQSLLATGFPYSVAGNPAHRRQMLDVLDRVLEQTQGMRRCGSASLDLCFVARGILDGFYEWGLKPWDIAAGALILQEAGGSVTDMRRQTHDMFADGIVATNGRIHEQLLNLMGTVG